MTTIHTLLLVEDEPELRALWTEHLATCAFHVHACATVDEARQLLESGVLPDVGVVDWSLPDGDGADVQSLLERLSPKTRVVLCTGHEGQVVHAASQRAAAVLEKPFRLRRLEEVLRQVMEDGSTPARRQ